MADGTALAQHWHLLLDDSLERCLVCLLAVLVQVGHLLLRLLLSVLSLQGAALGLHRHTSLQTQDSQGATNRRHATQHPMQHDESPPHVTQTDDGTAQAQSRMQVARVCGAWSVGGCRYHLGSALGLVLALQLVGLRHLLLRLLELHVQLPAHVSTASRLRSAMLPQLTSSASCSSPAVSSSASPEPSWYHTSQRAELHQCVPHLTALASSCAQHPTQPNHSPRLPSNKSLQPNPKHRAEPRQCRYQTPSSPYAPDLDLQYQCPPAAARRTWSSC